MPLQEMVDRTGMMTVRQFHAYHNLLLTHSIITEGEPEELYERFQAQKQTARSTRLSQSNALVVHSRLAITTESFVPSSATLWNQLPVTVRSIQNRHRFRTRLKQWIKTNVPLRA